MSKDAFSRLAGAIFLTVAVVHALRLMLKWQVIVASPTAPFSESAPEELRAKVKETNRILTLMSDRDAIERSFGTKFRRGDSLQQTVLLCRFLFLLGESCNVAVAKLTF
jgi:hypothetical protein